MDAKSYLRQQVASMQQLVEAAFEGLTSEQLTWIPPGTANPIGLTYLHIYSSTDLFLSILTGKPRLWESQNWSAKFNLAQPPGMGEDWTSLRLGSITLEGLQAYRTVVNVELEFYLDALTPESLDRPVKLWTDHDPSAAVLALLIAHTLLHAGEIIALKGVSGAKGLPF